MDARAQVRQQLAEWLAHLAHVLPAQAPIRDFVHHNTLHGFQHLPFAAAVVAAQRLTGAAPYWPEARFRDCLAQGRIDLDDLAAALAAAGIGELDATVAGGRTRRAVLLASLQDEPLPPPAQRRAWELREAGGWPARLAAARACLALSAAAPAADWRSLAAPRWQALCARLGHDWSWRSLLDYLSGEDVLERVRGILQRHLAAHLDRGIAAWRHPDRQRGFFAAWRASAGRDLQWELDELPNVRDEIAHLGDDALGVLADELSRSLPDPALWYGYLERLCLELPGWSGMFLRHDGQGGEAPVAMADYLAVRLLLERLLCADLSQRLTGAALDGPGLIAHYAARPAEIYVRDAWRRGDLDEPLQHAVGHLVRQTAEGGPAGAWEPLAERIASGSADDGSAWRLATLAGRLDLATADLAGLGHDGAAALLAVADELTPAQRGEIWLLAYERHYREQVLTALAANRPRRPPPANPSAQVVMCMDDREEGTRRHLEEVAPDIVTYGAAGFFGMAMYWQGIDDAAPVALCPVVVQPRHLIRETAAADAADELAAHAARRARRLRWRERLYQTTRRSALGGPLLSALAGLPALAALGAALLAPGWFGAAARRWRERCDGRLPTALAATAPAADPAATAQAPQAGFSTAEQIERVAAFLRMIGLTGDFAPLVLILGHRSGSRNNPHLAAYDCGACSGKHGGPNARVFATLANRPEVRAGLRQLGLDIPSTTWFVAAEHNTCDDGIDWYDLAAVPAAFQGALDRLVGQLGEACRAHAAERCRRLASAPLRATPWQARRHMQGRASDISQARPELGHATNAAALIGRRTMSRGLFLDRRVFLISYDPTQDDAAGSGVESILLAAGPVGAGISLEYYFSTVDNERYGCGSKITHNLTGLFGVMEGADSDLRTGLPLQMVEIHEPMRLLVVVEQTPAVLDAIVARQPALRELIGNAWINLAAQDPVDGRLHTFCPRRGWQAWQGGGALPQVARSADWFAGERAALPPALLLGAPDKENT